MKRFSFLFVMFVCTFFFALAVSAETVVKMTYMVKLPDVIREGEYTGETENGVPHGYGVFVAENSSGTKWHYLGEWENGEMCGEGGQYWDVGQSYVGTFANNDLACGEMHQSPSQNVWIDYTLDEDGCYNVKEYREDGTLRFDGCVSSSSGNYHKGTIYDRDGNIFLSGEIGEGFDWNKIYIN